MNRKKINLRSVTQPPQLRLDAAGIDISPEIIFVAVSPQCDPQPVRHFGTFTSELIRIADWLQASGVRTVAMESTGVYWIPLFQILEGRGFEVFLVNARHYKNVPGRKSDVCDSAWLQYLHSVGLLHASFRPSDPVCAFRTVLRHRTGLVQSASDHIQRMQKSLDQMNVQVHRVLSDITGVSGLAIVDAIVAGNHDPLQLAALCNSRVQAPQDKVVAALQGDYRPEHLFTLKQSLTSFRHYQSQIAECDLELRRFLDQFDINTHDDPPPPRKHMRKADDEELRQTFFRIIGTDLTAIPSINVRTVEVLLAEVGPDFSRFRSAGAFANWIGLCPNNTVTGGKVISSQTRDVTSRLATALRMAAESLCRDKSYLGQFYRRMKSRLGGGPQAITAAAHKLARIIFTLITKRVDYDESQFAAIEQRNQEKLRIRLRQQAHSIGLKLVPINANVAQ